MIVLTNKYERENEMNVDEVMEKYILMRDKRADLKKAFEEKDSKLKGLQELAEAWLLNQMNLVGVDQFKSAHGTAYKATKFQASMSDTGLFKTWAKEHDEMELIQNRLATQNLQRWMELHQGKLPPGVSVSSEVTVNIRRGVGSKVEVVE